MSTFLVFVAAAAASYALRVSMVVSGASRRLPAGWLARLSLVTPVVLSAIVARALFVHGEQVSAPDVAPLLAVATGAIAVRRFGSLNYAFLAGFPMFWAATAVGLG